MKAENITCPDDFDSEDIEYVAHLVPDGAFVTQMLVIASWMDDQGRMFWRLYVASGDSLPLTGNLGLLDLAKLDLVARTECGLPLRYPDDHDG